MVFVDRRSVLMGLGGLVASACSRPSASDDRPSAAASVPGWREETFEPDADQPTGQRALVFAPDGSSEWPLLVALHGRGEAGRGLDVGARGWRDDYDLDAIRGRLERGELSREDAKGFSSEQRLGEIRSSFAKAPWKGLVIACPYTPVPATGAEGFRPFATFVADRLLPRAATTRTRARTGIDGVSMGGRYALELGFALGEHFGAVGALQPAISTGEAELFATRAARAAEGHGAQSIQLVTSSDDSFREPTLALSAALSKRSIVHQLIVSDGPHGYIWNRGPGAIEMLTFHERVLHGLPAA